MNQTNELDKANELLVAAEVELRKTHKKDFETYIKGLQDHYFSGSQLLFNPLLASSDKREELSKLKSKIIDSITLYFNKVERGEW